MMQLSSPYDTALTRRYRASTPPPALYSLELPPIQNLSPDVVTPPSPESPNKVDDQNKETCSSSMTSHHQMPAFLEPVPHLDNHRMSYYESAFRPILFKDTTCKSVVDKIPSLQIPIPRRTLQPAPNPLTTSSAIATAGDTRAVATAATSDIHQYRHQHNHHIHDKQVDKRQAAGYSPMSPTMATASAAAAAAAVQHHPSSGSSSDDEALLDEHDPATRVAAEALAAASAAAHHRAAQEEQLVSLVMQNKRSSGLDHTKFLTKNAHIKRPRNAWIHFRCHYGQALKTQDPTLRAEEISKRASRRWARLTEKEKKPWHDLAEQEKIAHKEAFPEYRYCPKRHSPSSSGPSSSTSPTSVNPMHFHDAAAGGAEDHSEGNTSGHQYKKARRRTK
ncbi:hypothetical protein BX666DRAFT_1897975 [Dichotomocladium elegans]|nr:hypothetical protein BX666DRAFT_1897975 [Dichotomocladium elegans]